MSKLILGCGPHHEKKPGEILLDCRKFPNIDIRHNLDELPWPFEDDSIDSISAVHVVEHLHCLLIPFMDECWRILKPGGSLYLETPVAGGDVDLEWADPTHVRCYRIHSFVNYLSPEGIERFHYTNRPWNLFHIVVRDHILVLHTYPMKQ